MKSSQPLIHAGLLALLGLFVGLGLGACARSTHEHGTQGGPSPHAMPHADPGPAPYIAPAVVPGSRVAGLDLLVDAASRADVIVLGETHDRLDHHLNQLAVIRGLHERGEKVIVGMEYFHRPFQAVLDDYVAGRIDEAEMLSRSEYYRRWGFDYRLLRPILSYAREQGIPLIALNADKDLTDRIRESGVDGLSADDKQRLPRTIDRSNEDYASRLREIFALHPAREHDDGQAFQRFMDVQLIWDETMAQTAADAVADKPGARMVVLAGSGHVAWGHGIPDRLRRNLGETGKVVTAIMMSHDQLEPGLADYLLMGPAAELPPAGKIGILMTDSEQGVSVAGLAPGGAAEKASIPKGAIIHAIDGRRTEATHQVRVALLGKQPGDRIRLEYRVAADENLRAVDLVLGGAVKHHPGPR